MILEIHDVGGYVRGFTGRHFCRKCNITTGELNDPNTDQEYNLWTERFRQEHVDDPDYRFKDCPFEELDSFYFLHTLMHDFMHDFHEGLSKIELI